MTECNDPLSDSVIQRTMEPILSLKKESNGSKAHNQAHNSESGNTRTESLPFFSTIGKI